MTEPEIIAVLRLQKIPDFGDVTAKKLIAHCGSPSAIFEDKLYHLLKIDGIGKMTLKGLFDPVHLEEAQKEFEFLSKEDIDITYFMDDNYPARLKHCVDGPILLFQRGNINLDNQKVIGVVGTRNVTNYGTSFCNQFIEELAPLNPVIVSGLAYGVDIAIQKAAMDHGLQTIACMAHGYHREVFAVPGRATDKWSKGCNDLIKYQKAHLLTSAAELVYPLGWEIEEEKQEKAVQKQLFIELDETEQSIYSYLQVNGKQLLDTVAVECNLPIFKVSSTLLNMEMKGVIRPLPGKMFEAGS